MATNEPSPTDLKDQTSTEVEDHIAKRAALKADILRLIGPWRTSLKKPPFSTSQLFVMAIIMDDAFALRAAKVLRSIVHMFPFYGTRAINQYVDQRLLLMEKGETHDKDDDCVIPDLVSALQTVEVPLAIHDWGNWDDTWTFSYTIDPRAARIFLRDLLEPAPAGVFRFLDLPPELRNVIYAMTLRVPYSNLALEHLSARTKIVGYCFKETTDDSFESEIRQEFVDWNEDRMVNLANAKFLALLQTCRQIKHEAGPIFYDINTFHIRSTDLVGLIDLDSRGVRPFPFQLITRMCLDLDGDMRYWEKIMSVVAGHKPFENLVFHELQDWLAMPEYLHPSYFRTKTKLSKIEQVPGLDDLARAAAKAKNFVLLTECEAARDYFEAQIARIKAGKQPPKPLKVLPKKRGKN